MRIWTDEQKALLIANYANSTMEELMLILPRCSVYKIYNKAYSLGLKKSREYIVKYGGRFTVGESGSAATQFRKGQKPWNMGMKGLQMGGKETQFKKGNLPHNTRNDGDERITADGYIEVRIDKAVWKLKHRLVWEQHNGEIPKSHNVQFKDGNRQNCNIENLYIISRCKQVRQNGIERLPEELQKTIHIKRALTRLLNQINKEENENGTKKECNN